MSDRTQLPDDLLDWVADTAGGAVMSATRKPGGARKEAWFVDVAGSDGVVRPLFLHYDRADPKALKDPWTLHREATVCLALQGTPVPVARVIGVHGSHQAMLSERLVGESWFSRISDPVEQEETARDFIVSLAALHRLDPSRLDLPGFPAVTTIADAVRHELDEWDALLVARGGETDPALAFTLGWLRRHLPGPDGPVVLVQGDTGPGNFMYASGRVVAIVDWELAHLGDPMEDIAWLSLRATQEPFTDFPARLREYEAHSGNAIDEARVQYYRVMAEAKLQVMSHRLVASTSGPEGNGSGDIGNGFIYGMLHKRLWLEALAVPVGLDLTPAETPPAREARDHAWMYDAILGQLRHVVVPGLSDPLVQARAKGLARLVKYLARVDADGSFFEVCEHQDQVELLGHRPESVAQGRLLVADAVRSGRLGDAAYLRYLWRRIARETELARPAMGALADRHWPHLR